MGARWTNNSLQNAAANGAPRHGANTKLHSQLRALPYLHSASQQTPRCFAEHFRAPRNARRRRGIELFIKKMIYSTLFIILMLKSIHSRWLMVNRFVPKSPIPAGRGRGRPPRTEERRLEILEAFARCVARNGLEATTLDDVAREAGLQRAMIRHYVGNRDKLVREALEHLSAQYLSRAEEALDAAGNALDVDALLDFFFLGDYVFGMPEQNRVFDSLLFAAASDPEARVSLCAIYESFDELVRKHLVRRVLNAKPDRIGPVAWSIVCLAEQNIMMLGLGFPLRRSRELREVARSMVDLIR